MDTPKEDGGATSRAERHVVVPVERFAEMLAEGIAKQTEIDNLGDCESIVFVSKSPALNLVTLAEAMLSAAPPVQMEAVARYGLKSSTISGVHTYWQWTITKPDGSDLCTISATDADGPVDLDTLYANVDLVRDALNAYASPVPSSERDNIIEMCAAMVDIALGDGDEPLAEAVQDEFNALYRKPMNERLAAIRKIIASAIRSLKSQPAQESGGS